MSDLLKAQLQRSLGTAYTLERELGGGGMARVFVARDESLGREIVVKVLSPESAGGLSAERFAREVKLAARLQHPNIVPVLSAGERHGLAYYTMPYVEGESLRARLAGGRLAVAAAVSVLRDMARALEYAHGCGVVHRDVKPDNVLLAGSAATVTDFGIAKAIAVARTVDSTGAADRGGETLTHVGTALGTPMYMAPEQAAGDPHVDARADIYAWGVVAFELLAGAPPFAGRAAHQLIAAHIGEPPPQLAERAPGMPPALAGLVMRCLEKDPARRPQSASELLATLESARTLHEAPVVARAWTRSRWTVRAGGLLVASLLATAGWLASRRPPPLLASPRPVLAVLPFENIGAETDAYFADGLTHEVRARLTGISGLQVIGGTSAQQYKGTAKPLREIARELGATHLLTGSVRWDRATGGGRVRVSPELVRVADQTSMWAEPIDGPLDDVFAMQARVAERVASALDVALLVPERGTVAARPTANIAAYDAYLRGIAGNTIANRFSAAGRRAIAAEFERAVTLDPAFAAAHARLAHIYLEDAGQAGDARTAAAARVRARAAAERAWTLDSTLVSARLAHAAVLNRAGDHVAAERLVRETARAAPGDVGALSALANIEFEAARYELSLATYRRAVTLDPRVAALWANLAGSLQRLYRFEEAVEAHEQEIALAPDAGITYAVQAAAHLLWRADTAAARRTLERAGPAPAWVVRLPGGIAGGTIWAHASPASLLHARDTLTLDGYLSGAGGIAPELFHLMKLRHHQMLGRADRARAHADSLVARLEPSLQREGDRSWFFGWFSRRATLAEAYAMQNRGDETGRLLDRYVAEARRNVARRGSSTDALCHTLHNAAYVDVQVGRKDIAEARLAEALRLPCGMRLSRTLLRADPSWAPLRGRRGFEQLVAERD